LADVAKGLFTSLDQQLVPLQVQKKNFPAKTAHPLLVNKSCQLVDYDNEWPLGIIGLLKIDVTNHGQGHCN